MRRMGYESNEIKELSAEKLQPGHQEMLDLFFNGAIEEDTEALEDGGLPTADQVEGESGVVVEPEEGSDATAEEDIETPEDCGLSTTDQAEEGPDAALKEEEGSDKADQEDRPNIISYIPMIVFISLFVLLLVFVGIYQCVSHARRKQPPVGQLHELVVESRQEKVYQFA